MAHPPPPDGRDVHVAPVTSRRPALPFAARALIMGVVALGAGAFAAAWRATAGDGVGDVATDLYLAGLLVVAWAFPLVLHRGSETEAVQPDEAAFVITAILLPPFGVVCLFALAIVGAQAALRRPFVKTAFN